MQNDNSKEIVVFHNDEKISQAIISLLESNIGYSVDLYQTLVIRQLDDLTFAVSHEKYIAETRKYVFDYEKIFMDAKEATEFFLQKRVEYELGSDFEMEISSNKN
ncbi:MAG: hypothetical protein AAB336_08725 [Acidobacteriota bacterium]